MTGTTGETIAKSRLPRADIKSFDDVMDAVTALNSGQLDGIVTAFPTALQVTKKNSHLRIPDETLADKDSSVALHKGDSELLQKVVQ
ncbi:MAG: hypothetical protein B7Z29_21145 [Hyphomicrobium sp. 12-62-95]|nr:MAG: hypothetical protein B7Z29_21145 [Hyphomicrobium sp. 12-62-95]